MRYLSRNISIIKDSENTQIVIITDTVFHNKQNIAWDDVEKYLEQYVGEIYSIAIDGAEIFIGKDLPQEYAHSKYTRSLKGGLAKTKANITQAIPELIQISINKACADNHDQKHKLDAMYGWYRYDTRFAIAVYNRENEIERYNVYRARMIIRHDRDRKMYLYDIINIKKESEYPA